MSADAQSKDDREHVDRARSLDALSHVVGRFAHDFNNLLSTITLNLNLIEKKCSDPTILWFAGSAMRVADRGANLANRLLAFAGKQKLTLAPADLELLISGLRDLLSRAAGPTVELVLRTPDALWPVSVDRDQVEFALVTLTENARDAMPHGGVLGIELANTRIATPMSDLAAGDYVVLALEDTGEGLPEEALAHAFEPFFSTKRGQEHPGLGLSTVLGVAKAHGGTARLMEAAGGGCRVEIYLPRAREAQRCASPEPELGATSERRQASTMTVLVADDDPDLLAVAQEGLRAHGCDVLTAISGSAALEILASPRSIGLLMADLTLAGMNGLELIRRARGMRPGLRALIMTGGGEAPGAGEPGHGAVVLRKPFRAADLAQAIASVMSGDETR